MHGGGGGLLRMHNADCNEFHWYGLDCLFFTELNISKRIHNFRYMHLHAMDTHLIIMLIDILLKQNMPPEQVCSIQPLSVAENSAFVIDVDYINFGDLKADDLGLWKGTGTMKNNLFPTAEMHRKH